MKKRNLLIASISFMILTGLLCNACSPLKEFGRTPVYTGNSNIYYPLSAYDSTKKTVVIIANNDGTELFDMIAPFYLFNVTGKANVYIVAKEQRPIVVRKGLFVLPQFAFAQTDSIGLRPDVIVIPFLSAADSMHQDPIIISWIKKHYNSRVNILSICDGAATAAATGIFDGKPMTAHASDYAGIKAGFSKPRWIQNITVAGSDNLYSTAGVSNAVEGSLIVIRQLFGDATMRQVIEDINYPSLTPVIQHKSESFHFNDQYAVGKKIITRRNKKIGVLLQQGINEFDLAAVMDTYNRTFPKTIESYSVNDGAVVSKFGLTIFPTGHVNKAVLDELHVIGSFAPATTGQSILHTTSLLQYETQKQRYIIDRCLSQINEEYGNGFEHIVRLMLDYN